MTPTDLKEAFYGWRGKGVEYTKKQVHQSPEAPLVDRNEFFIDKCRGKIVLDIGASGTLHEQIAEVASKCYGIDRKDSGGIVACNLDDCQGTVPVYPDVEIIVLGEVIEHLSNPGQALAKIRLWYPGRQIVVSVPNAFSENAAAVLSEGIECVNDDHVSWLSYMTLKNLLGREGYRINELLYYNGRAGRERFSEGLIVVAE